MHRNNILAYTACAVFGLALVSATGAKAQPLPESIPVEWHVASFSGRVTKERVNRSTAELKETGNEPFWAGEKVSTLETGQAKLEGLDRCQIRLRENTKIRRADVSVWEVETGLTGFRFDSTASDTPMNVLITPWARVECRSGIVIVKVAPHLSRVAVLKGAADVIGHGGTKRALSAKQECAAVPGVISSVYDATDDLYFAWYWDKP